LSFRELCAKQKIGSNFNKNIKDIVIPASAPQGHSDSLGAKAPVKSYAGMTELVDFFAKKILV